MLPWEELGRCTAPDGEKFVLRRRGAEFLIVAGGYDLMSSQDEASSRALAELGCIGLDGRADARVLVGGLGMGFTLAAALDVVAPTATVEVAELVPAVVAWNRGPLAELAGRPLEDVRTVVVDGDVQGRIAASDGGYDVILLDVDNGPDALVHPRNESIYGRSGIVAAKRALRPGGILAVWSFSDDDGFSRRLRRAGFDVHTHKVEGSRTGRGRHNIIWTARRS